MGNNEKLPHYERKRFLTEDERNDLLHKMKQPQFAKDLKADKDLYCDALGEPLEELPPAPAALKGATSTAFDQTTDSEDESTGPRRSRVELSKIAKERQAVHEPRKAPLKRNRLRYACASGKYTITKNHPRLQEYPPKKSAVESALEIFRDQVNAIRERLMSKAAWRKWNSARTAPTSAQTSEDRFRAELIEGLNPRLERFDDLWLYAFDVEFLRLKPLAGLLLSMNHCSYRDHELEDIVEEACLRAKEMAINNVETLLDTKETVPSYLNKRVRLETVRRCFFDVKGIPNSFNNHKDEADTEPQEVAPIQVTPTDQVPTPPAKTTDSTVAAHFKAMMSRLKEKLSADEFDVLRLRTLVGHTFPEIAKKMGITVKEAQRLMKAALKNAKGICGPMVPQSVH